MTAVKMQLLPACSAMSNSNRMLSESHDPGAPASAKASRSRVKKRVPSRRVSAMLCELLLSDLGPAELCAELWELPAHWQLMRSNCGGGLPLFASPARDLGGRFFAPRHSYQKILPSFDSSREARLCPSGTQARLARRRPQPWPRRRSTNLADQ